MELEGQWAPIAISGHDVPCQAAWEQRGDKLYAWTKFRPPGRPEMTLHAETDLASIERRIAPVMQAALAKRMGIPNHGAAAGWGFMKKLRRKIKRAAKKIGKNKVLRAVVQNTRKVLDNPMVQQALASHPYGQSFLAARAAARVAAKALKGSKRAKNAIRNAARYAKAGVPKAQNMMDMFAQAMNQLTAAQQGYAQFQGDDPTDRVLAMLEAPAIAGIGCDAWHAGGEDAELQSELEMVDTLTPSSAASGAWDGVKWAAHALAPHSMAAVADPFTARSALLDGRAAMARRFA